jgi:hypothetical protein
VGKVVQPLQSVNCHDSHAHGHERYGPFTQLVEILVGMVWVESSRSGLALVICSYRCDSYELEALDDRG